VKVDLPAELGEVIGGYRLEEVIGRGGMGCVYRASHLKLGRKAAVKVLAANLARDAHFVARFFQEARIVGEIGHPNIVAILDYVDAEQPRRVAYVMELLEGSTLRAILAARPLSMTQAIPIALQISEALRAVHALNVVHRDLKPENVFVVAASDTDVPARPSIKILDFGIAKVHDPRSPIETEAGVTMGTPAYMRRSRSRTNRCRRRPTSMHSVSCCSR